jgi:hypothetical protein
MRVLLKALGGVLLLLILVLVIVRITGFNPDGPTPGLWLSGTLITAPVTDWSFANSYPTIEVQTNTWYLIPHSVTIYCVSYQNHLYLQAFGKMWNRNVVRDPHLRIKIANQLYDRSVGYYVSDPSEYWGVAQSMTEKYREKWPLPKNFVPNVFLRVRDN